MNILLQILMITFGLGVSALALFVLALPASNVRINLMPLNWIGAFCLLAIGWFPMTLLEHPWKPEDLIMLNLLAGMGDILVGLVVFALLFRRK